MSVKVELDKLLEVAAGFGTTPMLLTADDDGRPRASAVSVTWDGETARVNGAVRPLSSLLWPTPPGERFALLVDGEITATEPDADPKSGGYLAFRATGGILHVVDRPHG
jgi:hypothetical protein